MIRAVINDWGDRVHVTALESGEVRLCYPRRFCRECENERKELYMADQTKAKIRTVLEEHLGPSQREIGDQDRLTGAAKTIEWVNVTIGLETEFDIRLSELAVEKCDTIDQIARLIDTIVATNAASPH